MKIFRILAPIDADSSFGAFVFRPIRLCLPVLGSADLLKNESGWNLAAVSRQNDCPFG